MCVCLTVGEREREREREKRREKNKSLRVKEEVREGRREIIIYNETTHRPSAQRKHGWISAQQSAHTHTHTPDDADRSIAASEYLTWELPGNQYRFLYRKKIYISSALLVQQAAAAHSIFPDQI